MSAALALHDVHKTFGHTPIIRGISLEIERGERHAIIGPNGAGKSTLFNLISGRIPQPPEIFDCRIRILRGFPCTASIAWDSPAASR